MNKTKALIILLAANLVVMIYYGNSIRNEIRHSRDMTTAGINNLQNRMTNMEYSIVSGIGNELKAQTDKVSSFDYTYDTLDPEGQTAALQVTVALKEVSPSGRIAIIYTPDSGGASTEAELESQGGLTYGARLELSMTNNYEVHVVEKTDGAGGSQLNAYPHRLPLYDDFYETRIMMTSSGTSMSQGRLDADFSFTVKDLDVVGTELEKVRLQVLKGTELLEELDVTERVVQRDGNYAHIADKYKLALASGEIDDSVSLDQYAAGLGEKPGLRDDGNRHYAYTHVVAFDTDYPMLKLTMESAKELVFRLIVECEDGYEKAV